MEKHEIPGLTDKDSAIYTALVTQGLASIQKISDITGIKRPTVYVHIAEMIQKGLVLRKRVGKKEYYQAESPQKILGAMKNKVAKFEENVATLEYLYEKANGKPGVTLYEGEVGLNNVYEEICRTKELRFWSDLSTVEKIFPNAVRRINEATISHKIYTRDLIPNTKEAKDSSKRWHSTANNLYSSRLSSGPIFNDSVIYDNTLAFFRLEQKNLYVIKIEDPTIVASVKTLYDMAWQSATPFIN